MKTHSFTLILSGVAEITPELADALYAATRGDIELNLRDGVAFSSGSHALRGNPRLDALRPVSMDAGQGTQIIIETGRRASRRGRPRRAWAPGGFK